MTPTERVCTILEQLLMNGPMSFRDLRCEVQAGPWILAGDLVRLAELGFVELDPPLYAPTIDPAPATVAKPGQRLRLVVDNRKAWA